MKFRICNNSWGFSCANIDDESYSAKHTIIMALFFVGRLFPPHLNVLFLFFRLWVSYTFAEHDIWYYWYMILWMALALLYSVFAALVNFLLGLFIFEINDVLSAPIFNAESFQINGHPVWDNCSVHVNKKGKGIYQCNWKWVAITNQWDSLYMHKHNYDVQVSLFLHCVS